MTLAVGDVLVKVHPDTKEPVKSKDEAHVEFEVLETSYETDAALYAGGQINSVKLKILE